MGSLSRLQSTGLRRGITYVTQSPIVFNVSVQEQISYGSNNTSRKDIKNAAKAAGAHDFITRLPNGYDTLIGERGMLHYQAVNCSA